ncbi:hypothetical protein E1287_01685, partial [Actinomadura sp. KC06]|uniref:hypothetical protein n=1 Tax=Actinomadura sp. KC06 TaxID=2530369 RepID=UPI00104439D7
MTDYTGVEVHDEHVAALRSLLRFDLAAAKMYESVTEDTAAIGHTLMVYSAFAVAVHRKFAPKYSVAQILRYVADLRISLGDDASQVNPRVAECMIRAALGDETLNDHEPYGADMRAMMDVEMTVLLDLTDKARFDETGLDEFLRASADHAKRWLAIQRDRQVGEQ